MLDLLAEVARGVEMRGSLTSLSARMGLRFIAVSNLRMNILERLNSGAWGLFDCDRV